MDAVRRLARHRLVAHAVGFFVLWLVLSRVNTTLDPLWSYYLALAAMYATAMLGMVVLVGHSGQVSLGNGALMAVGGYVFALTSMNWTTVPLLGLPWNAVWSVIFAALGGVVVGVLIGLLGARLTGPYLAGLTLAIAVGVPAIANEFPEALGGSQGFSLTVPYPEGGYPTDAGSAATDTSDESALDAALGTGSPVPSASALPDLSSPAASDDLLTADDVAGGASVSPVPSAVASDDLLTADDVAGGASVSPVPSAVASESAVPPAVDDGSGDASSAGGGSDDGFVLEQWQASVALAVACIAGFLALNLVRGRQRRVWQAVRDDPVAASLAGIPAATAKVSAFAVSSLFAALAGAVYAQILAYVGPGAYGVGLSLSLLVGIILGGRSSLWGAVIGAVLVVGLPQLIAQVAGDRGWPDQIANNVPNLAYGLLVVLVVLVAPGGIVGSLRSGWVRSRGRASVG